MAICPWEHRQILTIMAKQTDGINGGFRGRVGAVVGYMWRGQWCVRTRPAAFHDARTERQLAQRELFKASVAFAGRVKEVLRTGLYTPALAAHKTECNYFIMINKRCLAWDDEGLHVDYPQLRVSEGPVAPVAFTRVEQRDERTLVIDFEKNPEHRRADASDKVYIAAFCAGTGEAELSTPVYRRTKRATVVLPERWEGQEVHLYGFVQDNAGRTSDSVYLDPAELAADNEDVDSTSTENAEQTPAPNSSEPLSPTPSTNDALQPPPL